MNYYLIEDVFYLKKIDKKDSGIFKIKETPKGFKITMIEKPYFMLGASEMAFNNKTKTVSFTEGKKTKHAVRKYGEEYVIYFYQSGIPCTFKKYGDTE